MALSAGKSLEKVPGDDLANKVLDNKHEVLVLDIQTLGEEVSVMHMPTLSSH